MHLPPLFAGVAIVGAIIWNHGSYKRQLNRLQRLCREPNGAISLVRATQILADWRKAPFGIDAIRASSLYSALGELVSTETTFAIFAERRREDEEGDDEGLGDGFGPTYPPGVDGNEHPVGTQENPRRVRRGQRRRAATTVYHEVVATIGLRADCPGQREVVMDTAVRIMNTMHVRKSDRPALLTEVQVLYFTPLEGQLQLAAVSGGRTNTGVRARAWGKTK